MIMFDSPVSFEVLHARSDGAFQGGLFRSSDHDITHITQNTWWVTNCRKKKTSGSFSFSLRIWKVKEANFCLVGIGPWLSE